MTIQELPGINLELRELSSLRSLRELTLHDSGVKELASDSMQSALDKLESIAAAIEAAK